MLQNVLHGDPKRNLVVLSPENPIKKLENYVEYSKISLLYSQPKLIKKKCHAQKIF